MKETTTLQENKQLDWENEIDSIISQIQVIVNNLIIQDENL